MTHHLILWVASLPKAGELELYDLKSFPTQAVQWPWLWFYDPIQLSKPSSSWNHVFHVLPISCLQECRKQSCSPELLICWITMKWKKFVSSQTICLMFPSPKYFPFSALFQAEFRCSDGHMTGRISLMPHMKVLAVSILLLSTTGMRSSLYLLWPWPVISVGQQRTLTFM